MARLIGLTGGIGSGKSTVAREFGRLGCGTVDADQLARVALRRDSDGFREVVECFGPEVIGEFGELDRAMMARLVFEDERARRSLEAIVHPRVRASMVEEVARLSEAVNLIVLEIPLLFETGQAEFYEAVVVVDCPLEERVRRLVEGRGFDEADARSRISVQMPLEEKARRAHHVIDNGGDYEQLRREVVRVLGALQGGASTGE